MTDLRIHLSRDEAVALAYLCHGHPTATHHVARACGFGDDTAKARRLLVSMTSRGLVAPKPYSSGRTYHYQITDLGRGAASDRRDTA